MKQTNTLPYKILEALKTVHKMSPVALHEPIFRGNEWEYLKDCLDSTYVSSVGKYVDMFESRLSELTQSKHAIAVVNGTAALHAALLIAGVKKDNEVLVQSLTFIATANAISYCNATPHFVDIEKNNLGMNVEKLYEYLKSTTEIVSGACINKNTGNVIKAIVPMHTFGHPSNIEGLLRIARDFNLILIEDAAESIGSLYKEKHTGTFGIMGILSFNGNKTVTTGGGGAVLTNNAIIAKKIKHITTTSKVKHRWEFRHDEIGYNYRMPNINAALGCAQLEQLSFFIKNKRALYDEYKEAFKNIKEVKLMSEPIGAKSNYWFQTLIIDGIFKDQVEEILTLTNNEKMMTRPAWELLHHLDFYKNCPKMNMDISEDLSKRIINIPSMKLIYSV